MAVVINDFEVVAAEPPQQRSTESLQVEEQDSDAREHELERLMEHQLERYLRIWAH